MVLGEMIGVKARAVVSFGNLETIFVIVRQRSAGSVEVIEDAEFHDNPS